MEKIYRIWLWCKMKYSKKAASLLVDMAGSPYNAYKMTEDEYYKLGILNDAEISKLLDKGLDEAEGIIKECERYNINIITPEDDIFPKSLFELEEPVLVLYTKGQLPDFKNTLRIAIVGTRHNTPYGEMVASRFSAELAREGVITVSGMAMGIDGIAMRAAIEEGGFVMGVMGRGLDEPYPKRNKDIFKYICENGCAISEYPPGTGALKTNFPERNRIVCALSSGILAVEAPLKSGTLITANIAIEMKKPLFSVPGNIYSKHASGTNRLLREGAVPVLSINDILEDFPYEYNKVKRRREDDSVPEEKALEADFWVDDPVEEKIIKLLKKKDMNIEEIASASGMDVKIINSHLTILEVEGIIKKLAGAIYRYNTEN